MSSPRHIAIIMDGNRRWAQSNGYPTSFGHISGVKSVKDVIKCCLEKKINYLSLFAFSTENWKRDSLEVDSIFSLMKKSINKYASEFTKHGIRVHTLGSMDKLPKELKSVFESIQESTKNNNKLNLILAIDYGGRKEILNAVEKWIQSNTKETLTEESFGKYISSLTFPDPDLVIRTGGVKRISNFYLWSAAYSEFYFSDLMWPEFDEKEMDKALDYYSNTRRRFGGE